MKPTTIERSQSSDGTLRLASESCSYTIRRIRPGVLALIISGHESGQLGRAALGEVAAEAALHPPLRLLIDMTKLENVHTTVSDDWTAWFRSNRHAMRSVDVFASSVYVKLTVAVSQMFGGLEDLVHIHKDAASFEAAAKRLTS